MDRLIEQLKRHEGYRKHVYRCSAGSQTIGFGYNLDANPLRLSSVELAYAHTNGMSEREAERLLKLMIAKITDQLEMATPFINYLDPVRQDVLINLCYNLGLPKFLKFKKTLALVKAKNYDKAAIEMLNSKWSIDVGNRALELSLQMKAGEYANG